MSSNMVLRCNPRFEYLRKLYKSKKFQDLYFIEGDYYWGDPLNYLSGELRSIIIQLF